MEKMTFRIFVVLQSKRLQRREPMMHERSSAEPNRSSAATEHTTVFHSQRSDQPRSEYNTRTVNKSTQRVVKCMHPYTSSLTHGIRDTTDGSFSAVSTPSL